MSLRIKKITLCVASMPLLPCYADIVTDGSLGPRTSLLGPNYEIVSNLGQRAGSNLFHSFGMFNVNTGENATFTGDGALGHIDNILGRVTGGASSNIDGRLASAIPGANLFLLNPAGILFGPNASLDLQGSFHASTTDFIRLGDGVRFNALPSGQDALLTTAPPEAFGFLGDHVAPIEVNDSFLTVPDGKTLSLVGGDITVKNGAVNAPGGQINLISTASPGEVTPALSGPEREADVTSTQLGTITISRDPNAARPNIEGIEIGDIDASGSVGGGVVIRGGQFVMENVLVLAQTFGGNDAEKGAGIDIRVSSLDMHSFDQDKPALISTDIFTGQADGGDVFVEVDTMRLRGAGSCGGTCIPTGILAQTGGEGSAGKITVHAGQMTVETGGTISTTTFSQGQSGDLVVDADNIILDGEDTGFATQSFTPFPANAGNVNINTNNLTLINGAQIRSQTGGPGRAGDISIQAEKIFLSGGSLSGSSSITSQQLALDDIGAGDAGDINVITRHLEVRNGANINALTVGEGQGGNMSVTAENILLVGDPSILFTGLSNETQNDGNAGNLAVTAHTLEIRDNARIEASTLFDQITGADQFSGQGGNITVTAHDISISGEGAGIVAKSTNRNPAATSGRIQVRANDSIRLEDRGAISVETVLADAGNIDIQVNELLLLRNNSSITTSVAGGEGRGGDIRIDPVFTILDRGSRIVAQAREGAGGNIRIVSDFFFASPDSLVSASSDLGIDGVVDIESPDTDVISGALELPESFLDAASLLSDRCSARTAKGSSSFIVSGRGGVPPGPETMLPVYAFDLSAKADGGAGRPLGEVSLARNCAAH